MIPKTKVKENRFCASQIDSESEWDGQDKPPESIHGSEYREMDDVTEKGVGIRTMPGDFQVKETPGVEEEHVPKLDRVDFIQSWRVNPLIPLLADDDPRKTHEGRIDLFEVYRERVRAMEGVEPDGRSARSEWTAVTEVDGEEPCGEYMRFQPGGCETVRSCRGLQLCLEL